MAPIQRVLGISNTINNGSVKNLCDLRFSENPKEITHPTEGTVKQPMDSCIRSPGECGQGEGIRKPTNFFIEA